MANANLVEMATSERPRSDSTAALESSAEPLMSPTRTGFFPWATGMYLVATAVLLALGLRRTHGTFVYVIDDPAIHLSVAQNLVHHATWGVTPHHFQSASSSPVWTLLLALSIGILPFARDYLPLALNLLAGLWLLRVVDRSQAFLRPSARRPLHVLATFVIVTFVLYLPGLAMTGMEHTLHSALVLSAVILFHQQFTGRLSRWPRWLPYVLIAVATLTRFETAMLAVGIGVAALAQCIPRWAPDVPAPSWRSRFPTVVGIGAASGVPVLLFAGFNTAMGQGLLPNSVLDKSQFTGVDFVQPFGFQNITARFAQDPLIPVLAFVALGYLALCRAGQNRNVFPAVVMVVATTLHMTFANVGWFERYQIYLIVLGVYTAVAILTEVTADLPAMRVKTIRSGIAVITCLAVVLAPYKWADLHFTPLAIDDTYRQRYQAARFLEQYYKGQSVATGELGYISLYHQGPITDLLGLGDYEVLRHRQTGHYQKEDFAQLARERRFKVVAAYPTTFGPHIPDNWIAVGTWAIKGRTFTAYTPEFWFFATTPEEVRPLQAHLRDYARKLPAGVTSSLNSLAEYRADVLAGRARPGPGDTGTCGRPDCSKPS